jgi:hypothetical protein
VINGNEAWVGDGNTTVKVVDVDAKAIKDTIDISSPPLSPPRRLPSEPRGQMKRLTTPTITSS